MTDGAIELEQVRHARVNLAAIAGAHPELTGPPSPENEAGWLEDLENIMGRPPAHGEKTVQVAFRLPESMVERIDAYVDKQRQGLPGVSFSRADAVRYLLTRALDLAEGKDRSR